MVILIPPMAVPDENTHFLNAYAISHGDFLPEVKDNCAGTYFPDEIISFVNENNTKYAGKLDSKFSFSELYFSSYLDKDYSSKSFCGYIYINPIGYTFSASGMALLSLIAVIFSGGHTFINAPLNLLTVGRLFNLAFYIVCGYYSLKIIPKYKNTLYFLLLMPMCVFQAVTLSYDAVLIPVCFLLFSFIINRVFDESRRIAIRDIVLVCLMTVVLAGVKQAYIVLLLGLFSIPKRYFENAKKLYLCIGCVILTALLVYMPYSIITGKITGNIVSEYTINKHDQLNYVITYLWRTPVIIIHTLYEYRLFYMLSFWGNLGQLDTNFPCVIMFLYYFLFFLIILTDLFDNKWVTKKLRFLTAGSMIIAIYLFMIGTYIVWTSKTMGIGANIVDGVQGRYFIPVVLFGLPFISLPFSCPRILAAEGSERAKNIAIQVVCISQTVLTILIVFLRFWI